MPIISRRRFLKISAVSAFGTVIAGVGGFAYAHDVEPENLEIVPVELHLPRLDPAFDGYRLAQISDIHMGTGITTERLLHIAEMVNAQNPDVIALTGDYVTNGDISYLLPGLKEGLSKLQARDGAFAILGNHDHWTDPTAIRIMLGQSGLVDMSNTIHTIRRGNAMLHLAGVDDYWEGLDRLDSVLAQLPAEGCAILLAHEPDFADISAETGRFDLQISGHSHGGQVRLPILNRAIHVPRYSVKYPMGQYQVGSMIQYTNRGVGTIAPAVRFNCRPEITVFTLRAAATGQAAPKVT
ncbi:MAG: metallophosphoesterase [Anaerolineaceae bacterium]|nr:metallophosphoesterase [Anaerolineaceae bacterium]